MESPIAMPLPFSPPTITSSPPSADHAASEATYPSADGSPVHRTASFWSLPTKVLARSNSSSNSTTAMSMDVGRSEVSLDGLRVWVEYGSERRRREILENESRWLIETLRPKLLAVEAAFREYEKALEMEGSGIGMNDSTYESQHHHYDQNSGSSSSTSTKHPDKIHAAATKANETMLSHRLRIEAIAFPSSSASMPFSSSGSPHRTLPNSQHDSNDDGPIRYSWTMYMSARHCCLHQGKDLQLQPQQQEEVVVGRGVVNTEGTLYTAGFYAERRRSLEM